MDPFYFTFVTIQRKKYQYKYSRVLLLPTRGVLLSVFWMAMILMMYSVSGLRSEQRKGKLLFFHT